MSELTSTPKDPKEEEDVREKEEEKEDKQVASVHSCRADCSACNAKNIRTGTCGYCRTKLCEECCRPDFEDDCDSQASNDAFDFCCMYCWLEDEAEGKELAELVAKHRAPKEDA